MIKLILSKFKCWENLTLDIPTKGIVLFKGPSGIGKTTIVKAIDWVLYGDVKKVSPFKNTKSKTKVILELNNNIIIRTKNPNKLKFNQYEDQEAQKQIIHFFGDHDVWLSSSYLTQTSHNFFLSSSNQHKMEILNKLCFCEQDPLVYIEKINKLLNEVRIIQQYQLEQFNKNFSKVDINLSEKITDEQVKLYQEQLIILKEDEIKYEKLIKHQDIQHGIFLNKQKELNQFKDELEEVNKNIFDINLPINLKNIDDIKSYKDNLSFYYHKLQHKEKLEKELDNIKIENVDMNVNFTMDDLKQILSLEHIYEKNDKILKVLNLPHQIEDIKNYIYNFEQLLLINQKNQLKKQLDKLILSIQNINLSDFDTSKLEKEKNNLILLQGEYQHQINLLKNKLICPYCEEQVSYQQGKLIKLNNINNNIDDVINKMKNDKLLIDQYTNQIKNLKLKEQGQSNLLNKYKIEKEKIEKEYDKLNVDLDDKINFNEKEIQFMMTTITQLKSIQLIELPKYSSNFVKNYFEQKENMNLKEKLTKEYKQIIKDIPEEWMNKVIKLDEIKQIQKYIEWYQCKHNKILMIEKNILQCQEFIQSFVFDEKINKNYEKIKIDIENINNILSKNIIINNVIQQKDELNKITKKLENLIELKDCATNIENKIVNQVVNKINYYLCEISQEVFDNDIKIELNLMKTLKVSSISKPIINFNILYKGETFDNIFELSCGEADRLSFVFTLVLNQLLVNHFIILDESFKFLQSNLKILMMKIIKTYINATVIIISHDDFLDPYVDHIIDIN